MGYKRWESSYKSGKIRNNSKERNAWEKSLKVAWKAWNSNNDPTNGAVFFVRRDLLGIRDTEKITPSVAKELAKMAKNNLKLSRYPLESVIPPKGHNFTHVFFRIKEK